MRFRKQAVLGIFFAFLISFSVPDDKVSGQPVLVNEAQNQLSEAFVAVQQADAQGVSQGQISVLAANLNLALGYLENATVLSTSNPTASNAYANKSITLSSSVAAEALDLTDAARNQSLLQHAGAYSLALTAAFFTALLLLEFHRLEDLVRRTRIRRMRID